MMNTYTLTGQLLTCLSHVLYSRVVRDLMSHCWLLKFHHRDTVSTASQLVSRNISTAVAIITVIEDLLYFNTGSTVHAYIHNTFSAPFMKKTIQTVNFSVNTK